MNTFQVNYSPALLRAEPIRSRVTQATHWLEAIVGNSAASLTAEWDMHGDAPGLESIILRLSDEATPRGVIQVFRPADLDDRSFTERRLYWLFSDLRRLESHKLLRELAGSATSEGV